MTFHPRTIVATAVLAAAGVAQQRSTEPNERHDNEQSSRQAEQREQGRVLAVRLLDHEIRGRGDREREIEDLVYDPSRHTIAYALVTNDEHGGYNGVPLGELEIRRRSDEGGELIIRPNGSKLDDWPMLDEDDWQQAATMHFAGKVAAERDPDDPGAADRARTRPSQGRLVLVSDLMDEDVVSESGDDIGDIENLAVDAETGRVPFVVVGTGGFLGMGETLRAIPIDKLRVVGQGDERGLVADVSSDEIEELPKFTRDRVQQIHADDGAAQLRDRASDRERAPSDGERLRPSADENDWIVTVWEVYSVPAVPVGAAPRIETEPARLPLELPSRRTTFTVEVDVRHERDDGPRSRNRRGRQRGAIYALSPAERQRDGAHKIDVSLTWYGAWDQGVHGADDRGRRGVSTEEASATERQSYGSTSPTPNGSQRHFTVTLERDGSISDFDTTHDARGRDWRLRKEAQEDSSVPLHKDRVRSHLELILGAGLHSRQLQPGNTYACSSREQGAMDFCLQFDGCAYHPGERDSDRERAARSHESAKPKPSTGANDALRRRSDAGPDRDGLARFSVMSHASHDRGGRERKENRWNGAALFNIDDGMIEDLHAHYTDGGRTCVVDIARHSLGESRREADRGEPVDDRGASSQQSKQAERSRQSGRR